jgi:hypothetical protein
MATYATSEYSAKVHVGRNPGLESRTQVDARRAVQQRKVVLPIRARRMTHREDPEPQRVRPDELAGP